jgi:site-specific DNA-methyltransferase (adenine-specific)
MCIQYSGVPKGSKIYDPFNGTGTTVLAAVKNGMYGIGTDIDSEYLSFSKQRIENALNPVVENPKIKKENPLNAILFEES